MCMGMCGGFVSLALINLQTQTQALLATIVSCRAFMVTPPVLQRLKAQALKYWRRQAGKLTGDACFKANSESITCFVNSMQMHLDSRTTHPSNYVVIHILEQTHLCRFLTWSHAGRHHTLTDANRTQRQAASKMRENLSSLI